MDNNATPHPPPPPPLSLLDLFAHGVLFPSNIHANTAARAVAASANCSLVKALKILVEYAHAVLRVVGQASCRGAGGQTSGRLGGRSRCQNVGRVGRVAVLHFLCHRKCSAAQHSACLSRSCHCPVPSGSWHPIASCTSSGNNTSITCNRLIMTHFQFVQSCNLLLNLFGLVTNFASASPLCSCCR